MTAALLALAQVVLIDITLAGDNAVVVGLAVAGLPPARRRQAIVLGVAAAALIRVALSLLAVRLLRVLGLTLAGGVLLLWVCWKTYRELRAHGAVAGGATKPKSFGQAIAQIALADLSMSLDNVLAVAGAAAGHVWVLVAGLALSVLLMGAAADVLARLLTRHRWIAWAGLAIVTFVAVHMIVLGLQQIEGAVPDWYEHAFT